MIRRLPFLLLLLSPPALSGDEPPPTLREPFPFHHDDHAEIFAKHKVVCLDCHSVGQKEDIPEEPGRVATCHGCHRQLLPAAPKRAPRDCLMCHAVFSELKPDSHSFAWISDHGEFARMPTSTCTDCHSANTCVSCHESRGALTRSPHEPAFRAVHGLDARLDPARCSACHEASFCTECHRSGGISP